MGLGLGLGSRLGLGLECRFGLGVRARIRASHQVGVCRVVVAAMHAAQPGEMIGAAAPRQLGAARVRIESGAADLFRVRGRTLPRTTLSLTPAP